jgi:hypothetical protein
MRFRDHRSGFLLRESGNQAGGRIHGIAIHGELDEVDTVLDLASNLLEAFGRIAHQYADRRTRYPIQRGYQYDKPWRPVSWRPAEVIGPTNSPAASASQIEGVTMPVVAGSAIDV